MAESAVKSTISFDRFTLDPIKRTLSENGKNINLNPKTFDLLQALIEKNGQIISKEDLLDTVWGEQFVEESNLTVNISLLRKALGEKKRDNKFIVTVPGTGYGFVAEVGYNGRTAVGNSSERAKEPAGRPKYVFPVLGILGAVVIVFAGFWIYNLTGREAESPKYAIKIFSTNGMPQKVNISPSGKFLAYVGRLKGRDSIWIGNISTGNSLQITQPIGGESIHINFSPDEEYVYFVARKETSGDWNLSRVSVFGGAVEELVKDVHSAITFSPDGKKIAFLRREKDPGSSALFIADAGTGADVSLVFRLENPAEFDICGVSWSPRHARIAALTRNKAGENFAVTLIDPASGATERIGEATWKSKTNIVWQKDGTGLIFSSPDKTENGSRQLWRVSYPEGNEQKLTDDPNDYQNWSLGVSDDDRIVSIVPRTDPQIWISPTLEDSLDDIKVISSGKTRLAGSYGLALSPDEKILFTAISGTSQTIWEMNPDGSDQKQLTPMKENSDDTQFVLTTDGRFLIFQSNRSGEYEIWRANRDGSDLRQLTTGGRNGEPTVSNDGKWVIYTHYKGDLPALWRIPIEGGKAGKISDEIGSFPMVSPDGNRLAARQNIPRDAYLSHIAIFPIEGGKPLKIFPAPAGILYNRLKWSPDGRSIIYKDNKQGLWRHDIETEQREKIDLEDDFRVSHFAFSNDGKKFVYSGGVEVNEIILLERSR
jgi:Tol biopolymer transport system component/DNA-binding winged helix-turn-helix (wHTH) protein